MSKFTIKHYFEDCAHTSYPADNYTIYGPDSTHFQKRLTEMEFETDGLKAEVAALVSITCYNYSPLTSEVVIYGGQKLFVVNSQNVTVDKIT